MKIKTKLTIAKAVYYILLLLYAFGTGVLIHNLSGNCTAGLIATIAVILGWAMGDSKKW